MPQKIVMHFGISIAFFFLALNFCLSVSERCEKDLDTHNSLLIVIRSQANEYHNRIAEENKRTLDLQADNYSHKVKVILTHQEWPVESSWAILPILPSIAKQYGHKYNWIMFMEDTTNVDLTFLVQKVLAKHDFNEEIYLGRCLVDREITIIHHFAFHQGGIEQFHYPDFQAGWIMSNSLLKKIAEFQNSEENESRPDFQIDLQHEIAMYLRKKIKVNLTCSDHLCGNIDSDENCVTWVDYEIADNCGASITLDDILISVKTTQKFHSTRVGIVKKTWGKYVKNILYYSNITDSSIPTIDCGVPNTVMGHCGKMEVIINDAHHKKNLKKFKYLVIADDDSIIGLSQLVKLLNCYKPNIPLVLGERYGFGLSSGNGYSYITGGGSMVMSRGAINSWVKNNCKCPSISTPDDMYLGQCFSALVGIPVTHSPRFHQARPQDYSIGYLSNLQPVSFHKHWEVDPIKVYEEYFAADDKAAFDLKRKEALNENNDMESSLKNNNKDEL